MVLIVVFVDQEDNGKGGCCPKGEVPNDAGDKCEKRVDDERERKRRGKCPDGLVLDPREGNSADDPNPKCQIDDEKNCQPPKLPATRPAESSLDKEYKVKCGEPPKEEDKAKCISKTHYVFRTCSNWGGMHERGGMRERCEKTQRFKDKKRQKAKDQEFRRKQKETWDRDHQEARKKKDEERKRQLEALEEERRKMEQERERVQKLEQANDKKKARMGKCAPVTALMIGVQVHASLKREDQEDPYDWTTDYFDEPFIDSDDFLTYWPEGVDVETIKHPHPENGVDAEAYMKAWEERVQHADLRNWPNPCGGIKRDATGTIDRRCQKRSLYNGAEDDNIDSRDGANDTLVERAISRTHEHESQPGAPNSIIVRDPNVYVPRNPLIFLIEIAFFAARLGMSLLARTASAVARYSPRLAQFASKIPDRLFQVAARGAGTPRGLNGMKNAMANIVKSPAFRQCVMEGLP
jgi:hypothetical protein